MNRDLLPDRLGGRLIASHIRLTEGGPVPDYVHYHKIAFQLIYCLRGRVRVVYEDQGDPFWLEPGDCVLQPPEIRHRVLACEAGSEVLELSSPAEHETWVEHEMTLPNNALNSQRMFSGQRFVRSIAKVAEWRDDGPGVEVRDIGLFDATKGLIDVSIRRASSADMMRAFTPRAGMTALGFVVAGQEKNIEGSAHSIITGDNAAAPAATEILRIEFRDS